MVGALLTRGMLVGIVAGLLCFGFLKLVGEPPVDRAAVVDVILGLSRVAEAHPEIMSIDVNPLVVVDGKPVAVDALVEVAG